MLTLAHAGCTTVAMVTPEPRHQSYGVLRLATAGRHRVPVLTRHRGDRDPWHPACRSRRAHGSRARVDAARRVRHRRVHGRLDPRPRARPSRRAADRCRHPGAARRRRACERRRPVCSRPGNLLHGAETAGVCASSGVVVCRSRARVARRRARAMAGGCGGADRVRAAAPVGLAERSGAGPDVGSARAPRRCAAPCSPRWPRIVVQQGDRHLWSGRVRRTVPTCRCTSRRVDAARGARRGREDPMAG